MPNPTLIEHYESGIQTWSWAYTMLPGGELCSVALTNGVVSTMPTKIRIEPKDSTYERYHLRQLYLLSHPNLRPDLRHELESGSISISGVREELAREAENAALERHEHEARELDRARRAAELARERQEDEKLRLEKIESIRTTEPIRQAVIRREIILGMKPNEVLLSWDEPRNRTETVNVSGKLETWWYSNRDTSLTFVDGILVSWTKSR